MLKKKCDSISIERLKELLFYDPETGVFYREGRSVGSKSSNNYIVIRLDLVLYTAHRLAWFYMTGEWPKEMLDHINRVKWDNRFCNLREATRSQNMQNQRDPIKSNTSGFLGVTWSKACRKWAAQIHLNKKRYYLGVFDTPEKAQEAYLAAKSRMHEFSPSVTT